MREEAASAGAQDLSRPSPNLRGKEWALASAPLRDELKRWPQLGLPACGKLGTFKLPDLVEWVIHYSAFPNEAPPIMEALFCRQ